MTSTNTKKPVRVFVDGCFDMVHYGHANAIRQAKQLGDYLIVGVHNDEEVTTHKGPPVYTDKERYQLVRSIKWVDEVLEDAPYFITIDALDSYNCDFVAHGDDITVSAETGEDVYALMKKVGRYKEFKRTSGVSTTDLVGRMLLMTKDHHERSDNTANYSQEMGAIGQDASTKSPYTGTSQFLATTQRIVQFSSGIEPKPGDKIVYTAGAFDLLHAGHVSFLEKVAKEGDYVIVGCHTDLCVNWYKGSNFPIMNLHERVLGLLSCRYVSEVVIGAPYVVNQYLMDHFKIDLVIHGRTNVMKDEEGNDPYEVPKKLGKFKIVDSESEHTTANIVARIIKNRLEFEKRNKKKQKRELDIISEGTCKDEIDLDIKPQDINIKDDADS